MPVLGTSPHKLKQEAVAVERVRKFKIVPEEGTRRIPSETALKNFFRTYNAIFQRVVEEDRQRALEESRLSGESQDTTG